MRKTTTIICAALCLAAGVSNAQNLLLNGAFNTPGSAAAPDNWTAWSWGGGWANHENNAGVSYDGSYYVVAGAGGSAGGGFFQTVLATAGTEYQLSVLSGADAWWQPHGAMTMHFLDGAAVEVGLATRNTVDPAVYGNTFDQPHPWESYSLAAIAPANTTQIKVEFDGNWNTGSTWFENASLVAVVPEPGTFGLMGLGAGLLLAWRRKLPVI